MKARVASAAPVAEEEKEKGNPLANIALVVAATPGHSGMTSSNPFASVQLVKPPSLPEGASSAGAGIGGFGAFSKINPFAAASSGRSFLSVNVPKSPGRVNPYSSPNSSASNPFMTKTSFFPETVSVGESANAGASADSSASAPLAFGGGSKPSNGPNDNEEDKDEDDGEGEGEGDDYNPEAEVPVAVPQGSEPLFKPSSDAATLVNGEEGESCSFQMRAKLYRLDESKPGQRDDDGETQPKAESPSTVPTKAPVQEWVEVGTGPLRVLIPQAKDSLPSARIVMRREAQAGGLGTKLILNVVLTKLVQISKTSPNMVRLTCVDTSMVLEPSGSPRIISYLLKSKVAQVCMLIERSYIYNILAAIVTIAFYFLCLSGYREIRGNVKKLNK